MIGSQKLNRPRTDVGDLLVSNGMGNDHVLLELGLIRATSDSAAFTPVRRRLPGAGQTMPIESSGSAAEPIARGIGSINLFALSQWGLEHASPMLASLSQCGQAADFLQNSILEKVRERNMQSFLVQKDIIARHPRLSRWPVFVQEFIAGPMCGLIAMAELHKTMPGVDVASIHKIVDNLIWSSRLSTVGLDKTKLIEGLPKLRSGVDFCCLHLGIKNGTGYIDEFNERLLALHLDLIDASSKLIEFSSKNKKDHSRIQGFYRDLSAQINSRHPCTVPDASGWPQPYVWPGIWLTPAESTIDAAVQLQLKTQGINHFSDSRPFDGRSTARKLTSGRRSSDREVVGKLTQAFERSEGKRYFHLQRTDGTGWDLVRLTWSNGASNKPASMFAVTTKDGAMFTMSRRRLSAMIANNALRELPDGVNH